MTDVQDTLSEIKVSLANLNGKVDTMDARMEAGDKQLEQVFELFKANSPTRPLTRA